MGAMASQITSLTIVYSIVYSGANQRKHQSSASLAFVGGIHRRPVNSPHKGPVTRKMLPFDNIIMQGIYNIFSIVSHLFIMHLCSMYLSMAVKRSHIQYRLSYKTSYCKANRQMGKLNIACDFKSWYGNSTTVGLGYLHMFYSKGGLTFVISLLNTSTLTC